MSQESIRSRLINYLESDKGLSQKKVSNLIGVPDSLMSKFKNAKRELWESNLVKLDQFLKENNF